MNNNNYKKKFISKVSEDKKKEFISSLAKRSNNHEKEDAMCLLYISNILDHNNFREELFDAKKTINSKGNKLFAELNIIENKPNNIIFEITNRHEDSFKIQMHVPRYQSIVIESNFECLNQLNDIGDYEHSSKIILPQKRGQKNCGISEIEEAQDQFIRAIYQVAEILND